MPSHQPVMVALDRHDGPDISTARAVVLRRLALLAVFGAIFSAAGALAGEAQSAPSPATVAADSLGRGSAPAAPDTAGVPIGVDSLTVDQRISRLNALIMQDPRNADHYNNLGVLYAQQEKWVQARDAFISAVQANPFDADFHRNLAQVMVRLENYEMAVLEFQAYQRFDPLGGVDGYWLIGQTQRQAGLDDKARTTFETGLQELAADQSFEKIRLVVALAQLHQDNGRASDARSLLEGWLNLATRLRDQKGTDADPESATLANAAVTMLLALYIEDGQLLSDSGLPLEAAELFEKAYNLAPERDELLPKIVNAYLDAGEGGQADRAARQAQADHPEAAGTWVASGVAAESAGRLSEALDAFLKARDLDPENRNIDLQIGSLYMKQGDSGKARQYLAAGISSPDASIEFVYNYGVSLLREEKYAEAIAPLRQVVEREPEMSQAWQALALGLRMAGRYGEAVDAYRRALEFGPDPKLTFNLALCLSREGKTDEAVAAYREAIALDPGFKEAHYNLSRALITAGRYEEAFAALQDHAEIEPDSYRILFNQGLCLYHLGRYEEAIEHYDLALEQKETADLMNNIGLVYDKLGNKEEANRYFREAKKLKGGKS